MGWQKRSYGRRYYSSREHAFIICGISKGLYSKACQKCYDADKTEEKSEGHEFRKKFGGSSKIMEASAIMKIVEDTFCHCCFIIDVIVGDNYSTMRDFLKHPSICA